MCITLTMHPVNYVAYLCRACYLSIFVQSIYNLSSSFIQAFISLSSFSPAWKSEGAPVGILRREIWGEFNLRHNKRWRRDIANNGHDSGAGLGICETRDGISGSSTGSGSSVQWDQGYQERSLIAAQKLDFPKKSILKTKIEIPWITIPHPNR